MQASSVINIYLQIVDLFDLKLVTLASLVLCFPLRREMLANRLMLAKKMSTTATQQKQVRNVISI